MEAIKSLPMLHHDCARPAQVPESGPWTRLQVLQNSASQMFMLKVKALSDSVRARTPLTKFEEKIILL